MTARADATDTGALEGTGRSSWGWAAACSVVFHVGLVVVASLLPDGSASGGGAKRDRLFTPGAVIPIETVDHAVARAEPIQKPVLPTPTEDPVESPTQTPTAPRGAESQTPSNGSKPPPDPTEAQAEPNQTPGLSLHGLRDNARASTVGASKGVVVDPSMLQGSRELYQDSVEDAPGGGGGIQGPAAPSGATDYSFTNEKGKLVYRDPAGRFIATLSPDGRVNFRNKGAKGSWTNIGLAGPGDALMAAAGDDPYARLKAKLLKATFEMRLGMAVDFQKKQLDKRLARLDGELKKIWADERRALGDRKELLFQRWDECDEPGEVESGSELPGFGAVENSELDDAREGAATSARKRILKFIRENAPKGSPEEFTASELANMNGRRVSKEKFNPYD